MDTIPAEFSSKSKDPQQKRRSFYTHVFSSSFLFVVFILAATLARTLLSLTQAFPTENAAWVALILPITFFGLCLHRYRVRRLMHRQPNELLLDEMSSIVVSLVLGICLLSILVVTCRQ